MHLPHTPVGCVNVGVNRAKIMSAEACHIYAKTNSQQSKQGSSKRSYAPHGLCSHILQQVLVDAEQGQGETDPMHPNLHTAFCELPLSSAFMRENLNCLEATGFSDILRWSPGLPPLALFYICGWDQFL